MCNQINQLEHFNLSSPANQQLGVVYIPKLKLLLNNQSRLRRSLLVLSWEINKMETKHFLITTIIVDTTINIYNYTENQNIQFGYNVSN